MGSRAQHFASYAQMDIALDPVAYHGTTTTCEALWMGRPVVTLAGDRHVRRVGASLLTAVGEADCVCTTESQFVEVAARLAADRAALAARATRLRPALRQSALGDGEGQGKAFAEALGSCWIGRKQ
jgi:predicted O-linked N-acetylglucosamine transferase (SPINDLY family)